VLHRNNAYQAPGHFINFHGSLSAGERLALAEHIIGMAEGYSGDEGKILKADATLEAGESLYVATLCQVVTHARTPERTFWKTI
jgi:hypothetical protein